jgi:TonB family protein
MAKINSVALPFALLAITSAANAQFAASPPVVQSEPMFFAYPASAFAAKEEGRVGVELAVTETGQVERCTIIKPVSQALDEASCSFWTRARFRAAYDDRGQPIRAVVTKFSDWHLRY